MIKKLIPAAVLAAAMGTAHAGLDFYGVVDLSYGKNEHINNEGARIHSGGDDGGNGGGNQGNSTTRIGLKGGMDIGNGLKANFKFESAEIDRDLRIGRNSKTFFSRQAWAGLSGGFGEVRFGRQDSVPFQTMINYDFNGAANAASALAWSGAAPWGSDFTRQTQSLQYISPNMNGFTVQVGFAGKEDGVADAKSATSLGLTYAAGKFSVSVAGQTEGIKGGESLAAVAGSYDFGVVKVMVGYADGVFGGDNKGPSVGFVAPVAGFNVGMHYAKNTETKDGATEFFVNREIYKNTYAYLDYGRVSHDNASSTKAYALGVIYVFELPILK